MGYVASLRLSGKSKTEIKIANLVKTKFNDKKLKTSDFHTRALTHTTTTHTSDIKQTRS